MVVNHMNTNEFFLKYNNKFLDFDGAFGSQCVDPIKAYFAEVLNLPVFKGDAINYWLFTPPGFTKIPKTMFNRPEPGDIVVFSNSPDGHIAICNWSRFFDFGGFEQNFPLGSPCHFQDHKNYKNVLGWLRPIPQSTLPKVPLKIARIGSNLPFLGGFQVFVALHSSNKISLSSRDYSGVYEGIMTQDMAYQIVDQVSPKEKFVFLFYKGTPQSVFFATYYYPKKDCMITTCPANDSRLLSFEFSHQLQTFFNQHRGSNPPVQVIDSNFPSDELIKSKYDSISKYYE